MKDQWLGTDCDCKPIQTKKKQTKQINQKYFRKKTQKNTFNVYFTSITIDEDTVKLSNSHPYRQSVILLPSVGSETLNIVHLLNSITP